MRNCHARSNSAILDGKVVTKSGRDVTLAYQKGAEATVKLARMLGRANAILQKRNPSCGTRRIYDGTFRGNLVDGNGVAAQMLIDAGIVVVDEDNVNNLFASKAGAGYNFTAPRPSFNEEQ